MPDSKYSKFATFVLHACLVFLFTFESVHTQKNRMCHICNYFVPKQTLHRSGPEEAVLCLVRHHKQNGDTEMTVIIVGLVVWDGITDIQANKLYEYLPGLLAENAEPTIRKCAKNDK